MTGEEEGGGEFIAVPVPPSTGHMAVPVPISTNYIAVSVPAAIELMIQVVPERRYPF